METWIIITVAAAFIQNIRSSLQKYLKSQMGTAGATFVRFGFGVPFALLFLWYFTSSSGHTLPAINPRFIFWVIIAAVTQIIAQALLVHLFSFRNFAVGSAYSRTEPVQAALFGLIFLAEKLTATILGAIAISVIGVMMISVARTDINLRTIFTSVLSRTALIGLASGTFFGIAAVSYRAASLSLDGPTFFIQAAMTLSVAIVLQSIIMIVWIYLKDRAEFGRIKRAWKVSVLVGLVGASASFGWFSAMTLQQAALVKAVAQIELLFTFATSVFIFKEHINRLEITGCMLIVAGILALIFVAM